jgi:antirestriction protein ArdC
MCATHMTPALEGDQTMSNPNSSATPRRDLYQHVTARILEDLERGVRPWLKPWGAANVGTPVLPRRHNGIPYQGVNVLLLWGEARTRGYSATTWMTYRQAQELGAQVRKGQSGSLVVFADRITRTEDDDNAESVERSIQYLKSYSVFNVEQIDGLPAQYVSQPLAPAPVEFRHARAEAFIAATRATIRYGGNRAYYAPAFDFIQLPPPASFRDMESYYGTTLHELTHWTGHASRCARDLNGKRFGSEAYAFEELVAELGSAFLCAEVGVTPEVRDDHAAYLASWLKVLNQDKRAIFTAAAQAQRAADFLRGLRAVAEESGA